MQKYFNKNNLLPIIFAILFFAMMAAAYRFGGGELYHRLFRIWGVAPFPDPFADAQVVLAAATCHGLGYDVYVTNPCERTGMVFNYSPLWLALAHLPVNSGWVVPAGTALFLGFLASLAVLPTRRRWPDALVLLAGVTSSASVLAIERGNFEIILFMLAVATACLITRSPPARLLAYTLSLLAGLLKYFPMVLMLLALRERWRVFLALTIASLVVVALFAAFYWHDLIRGLTLAPYNLGNENWGGSFGARKLGGALTERFGLPAAGAAALRAILTMAALAAGLKLSLRRDTHDAIQRLTEQEQSFLLVGSLLVASTFLAAQNYDYRTIHLLMALPVFMTIRSQAAAWHLRLAAPLTIILMWSQFWIFADSPVENLFRDYAPKLVIWARWLVFEAMWWVLCVMLLSYIMALLGKSRLVAQVFAGR